MKLKQMLLAGILSTTLLTSQVAYAASSTSKVTFDEDGNLVIITEDNERITEYVSTVTQQTEGRSKVTINASFIDDKNASEMTAILSLKGFIPSNKKITAYNSRLGIMEWPYEYGVKVENIADDSQVQIADSVPKNRITTSTVSSSISYSIGGGIDVSKSEGGANLNGNYSFSKSISYEQPEYTTIQLEDSNDSAAWKTTFSCTKDGYDLNSWTPFWGNQMFMVSRHGNTSATNFLGDDKLSSLISGGFSPNVGLALVAPYGTQKSRLKVTVKRHMNSYYMDWIDVNWKGHNHDGLEKEEVLEFEIDWENHKITSITK